MAVWISAILVVVTLVSLLSKRFESNLGSYSISHGNTIHVQININGLHRENDANLLIIKGNTISKYPLDKGNKEYMYSKDLDIGSMDLNQYEILVEWITNNKRQLLISQDYELKGVV
ncbi:MAG: hypothetical protein ACQEXX_12790 [Bacillota bacterium]